MLVGTLRRLNGEKVELDGRVGILKTLSNGIVLFKPDFAEEGYAKIVIGKEPINLDDRVVPDLNLKLLDHPLRGVERGDVLVSNTEREYTVKEVLVNSVLLTWESKYNDNLRWWLFKNLEDSGYTLKGQEEKVKVPPKELPMSQDDIVKDVVDALNEWRRKHGGGWKPC